MKLLKLFVKVNSSWVWKLTLQTGLWKLTLQIKHYIIKEVPLIPMAPLEVRQYIISLLGSYTLRLNTGLILSVGNPIRLAY